MTNDDFDFDPGEYDEMDFASWKKGYILRWILILGVAGAATAAIAYAVASGFN